MKVAATKKKVQTVMNESSGDEEKRAGHKGPDENTDSGENSGDEEKRAMSEDKKDDPCWLLVHTTTSSEPDSGREDGIFDRQLHAEIHGSGGPYKTRSRRVVDIRRSYPGLAFVVEKRFIQGSFFQQKVDVVSQSLGEFLDVYKPSAAPPRFGWDMNLLIFNRRQEIERAMESQEHDIQVEIRYLLEATREDNEEATGLFDRGLVTLPHITKLFIWHTVLVSSTDPVETFSCSSRPLEFNHDRGTISLRVSHWLFDGRFHLVSDTMRMRGPQGLTEITTLKAYPLRFASPEVQQVVAERNKMFWMCRRGSFVSYLAPDQFQRTQGVNKSRIVQRRQS